MLVHDGLANIHAVHVASVADIAEAEVEVAAVEADPVANSLSQVLLGVSRDLLDLEIAASIAFGGALIQNLVLALNTDLIEGLLDDLELLLFVAFAARALLASVRGLLLDQVLWLAVKVSGSLGLVASIAFHTALEVVVLALATDPAAVREIEAVLV